VVSVCLYNDQGVCIDKSEQHTDQRKLPNIAFIMLQAKKLSNSLKAKVPEYVNIFSGQYRYFIVLYNELYLTLQMDKKVKSDVVMPLISKAIGVDGT
jgi:hypothetical protein